MIDSTLSSTVKSPFKYIILAVLLLAGCRTLPRTEPTTAAASGESSSLKAMRKELAAKEAEVTVLKAKIKAAETDKLVHIFYWASGGFGLLALGFAVGAWFLPLWKKLFIKGIAFCGAGVASMLILAKLAPYRNQIAAGIGVALLVSAWWYYKKRRKCA